MSPRVVQLMLPFMKRLAKSPRAEQTGRLMEGLGGLTEAAPQAPMPSAWQRLQQLTREPSGGGLQFGRLANGEPEIPFQMSVPGRATTYHGWLEPDPSAPQRAELASLKALPSAHVGYAPDDVPPIPHVMNIAGGAQRELPFRGMRLGAERARRDMRIPEDRNPGAALGVSRPTMSELQPLVDRLMATLRRAGFGELGFQSTPGRARLYERMTGFKAEPAYRNRTVPTPSNSPMQPGAEHAWMADLNAQTPLDETLIGVTFGMLPDEAIANGFVRETADGWRLTARGVRDIRTWLRGG